MSQSEEPNLLGIFGERGIEAGGRFLQGIYSTPWTGIPFTIIVLAQIDPSGQLTARFLENLGVFTAAIGKMIFDALSGIAGAITGNIPQAPPGATPTMAPPTQSGGKFCIRITWLGGFIEERCYLEQATRDFEFNRQTRSVFHGLLFTTVKVEKP